MYKAITKNGNTFFYYNEQLILKAVTSKYFCYYKFYIEDVNNTKLFEASIVSLFGFFKKYSIKKQKLNLRVELFKNSNGLVLKLEDKRISVLKKRHIMKFEGDFILNGEKQGEFYNHLTMFESSFTFSFQRRDEINIYFFILFSIIVIDKFNFGPSA